MATETAPEPVQDAGTQLLEDFPVDPSTVPEPAAEASAEPAEEVVAEPAKPVHPSWLARAAKQVGLDESEIAGMATDELRSAVDVLSKTREPEIRRDPETGRFTKPAAEAEAEKPFTLKDIGIDDSKWTEGATAVEIATDIVKPLLAQINELKKELDGVKGREHVRERDAHFDRLDKLFTQDESLFGKGTRQSLKAGTPEALRRNSVIGAMQQIKQSNPSMSLDEVFEKATGALFAGMKPQESGLADPKGFLNGHTARPTVRQTKPTPKGDKAAIEAVAQLLATRSEVYAPEQDDLPD